MSDPTYSPRLAGDYADDDGDVIESLFEEAQAPADPEAALVAVDLRPVRTRPRPPSRVFSEFFQFDANSEVGVPRQIQPPDLRRTKINIGVRGPNAASFVFVADEPNKLPKVPAGFPAPLTGQAVRRFTGENYDGGDHTGAVWLCLGSPLTGTDVILITWMCVSSGTDDDDD